MARKQERVLLVLGLLWGVCLCRGQDIETKDIISRLEALEVQGQKQKNIIEQLENKIVQQKQLEVKDVRTQRLEAKINKQEQQLMRNADKIQSLESTVAILEIIGNVQDHLQTSEMANEQPGHSGGVTKNVDLVSGQSHRSTENDNDEGTKDHHGKSTILSVKEGTISVNDLYRRRNNRQTSPVAFLAKLSQKIVDIGDQAIIKFDQVDLNLQNAYHPHLGVLIAPRAGLYILSFDIQLDTARTSSNVHFGLTKNGNDVLMCHASINAMPRCSATGIVQLAAGDEVWVRTINSAGVAIWPDSQTSFTGALFYPM